jgi:hypothetical protein
MVLVVSTGVSMAPALMAPGTDSVAARLAEWGRDHYLGWAVTALEQLQYAKDKPTVGGSIAGGLPTTGSPSDSSSSTPHAGPATTAAPGALAPLVDSPLAGEGVWRDLYSVNGAPAARVASLRPDTLHTSYHVQVVWMDPTLASFRLHPGYKVPGPAITPDNQITPGELNSVLATFNSHREAAAARIATCRSGRNRGSSLSQPGSVSVRNSMKERTGSRMLFRESPHNCRSAPDGSQPLWS